MEIAPDIIETRALEQYYIYIKFETGEEKIYDMKELIDKIEYYNKLKNREQFKNVKPRGDTIEWENGEDVAPEKLYFDSVPINQYKGKLD